VLLGWTGQHAVYGEGGRRETPRTRTRRWKVSLPAFLAMYLLAAMRPASRDSDESCSFSQLHSEWEIVAKRQNSRGCRLRCLTSGSPSCI